MTYKSIHRDFRLNGIQYSREELKEVAYSLIKEGETFEKSIGDFLLDWLNEKPMVEVQTSGSTGEPKKIELQKCHMVNSAKASGEYFNVKPGNTALLCLSSDYIAGKMMLVRAMVLGLQLDYIEPSSNPLRSNSKTYDFCAMVPLQVQSSLDKLTQIKTLIVGGAPISHKIQFQVQLQAQACLPASQVQNAQIFETYGMTETITHIAIRKVTGAELETRHFKALSEVLLSVDDRNCLVIDAPKISESVITTNDVVNLISDSEFEWLGRFDNVINSGGVKLFPERIEAKLASQIEQRFFVAALPDEKLGQKLVLIVEGEIAIDGLSKKISTLEFLDDYEIPKEIFVLPAFLDTETGKIRRTETLNLL